MPPTDNPYTVGQMVKLFREAEGESQIDLAKAVGVETWKINKIEHGNYNPDPSLVKTIAEHYNIPLVALDITVFGVEAEDPYTPRYFQDILVKTLSSRIISRQEPPVK